MDMMRGLPAEHRKSLRYSMAEGLFTAVAGQFAGNFLTPYALHFGATKSEVALLNIIPNAMSNSLQLIAFRFTERIENRRAVVILAMLATRLFWLPMALVPLFFAGRDGIYWLVLVQFLIGLSQSFAVPAWTSIMSDLVPREIRGRFFAQRNIIMNIGAVLAVIVAGRLISALGFPRGYQAGIAIYFMLGSIAVYCFSLVRVPPANYADVPRDRLPLFRTALNLSTPFGRYVSVVSLHSFSVGLVSSLFSVFLLQELGGTVAHMGYMTAASTSASIAGHQFWGPIIDRRGERPVMALSAFTIALIPALWLIARTPWHAVILNVFAGLAWSGWTLGTFNTVLLLSPESRKQAYVAVGNSMPAVFGMVGPLVGGAVADVYGIRPLMAISALGRLLAAVLFLFAFAHSASTRRDVQHPKRGATAD